MADFTPIQSGYLKLKPFRFWCQKVLPLVYDDSLSYYELLCKVVDYLNKTMEDVNTLEGDVTAIYEAYNKLQDYVNDYFKNMDVQEEINNKLDEMAEDGTLGHIIEELPKGVVKFHRVGSFHLSDSANTQGFTVHNGIAYVASRNKVNTAQTKIISFNVKTGTPIAQSGWLNIEHCNSLMYHNNHLIAISDTTCEWFYITCDTFQIVKQGRIPDNLPDGESYYTIQGTCVDDSGNVYGVGIENQHSFFRIPWTEENGFDYVKTAGSPVNTIVELQNACISGGVLYALSNWTLFACDLLTMNFLASYPIYKYADDLFSIGEVEQLSIDTNGIMYCNGNLYQGNYNDVQYGGWRCCIYSVDIMKDAIFYSPTKPAPTHLDSYRKVFVRDDHDVLDTENYPDEYSYYANDGYTATRAISITEAISMNPYYWYSLELTENINSLCIMSKTYIEGNNKTIGTLVVEHGDLNIGSVAVTKLIVNRGSLVVRGTGSFTSSDAEIYNSIVRAPNVTLIEPWIVYSDCILGTINNFKIRANENNNVRNRLKANMVLTEASQYTTALRNCNALIVVTSRASYLITRTSSMIYPISKDVNYDTYLSFITENGVLTGPKEFNGTSLVDPTIAKLFVF